MKAYEKYIKKDQVETIHENSVRIMSEVGINFENERALDVFRKRGAKIDGYKVFIPEKLINEALSTTVPKFTIYGKDGVEFEMGESQMLCAPVGFPAYISDAGKIRAVTSEDAKKQFKMSETSGITNKALINYAILNGIKATHEQRIMASVVLPLMYSDKAVKAGSANVTGLSADETRHYIKETVKLNARFLGLDPMKPMDIGGVNPLSPLTFDAGPIEKLFAASESGQPVAATPCAMPILTAPPSVGGMMAQTNAETLAALVLIQLHKPGAPFLYSNTSASTDMRTIQLCIASPEAALVCYATAALADYYNLPFRTGGGLGDSKQFDAQAGAESMMMLKATYDVQPDYVSIILGCMGQMNILSLEKYILDEEVISWVKRLNAGIDTSEERMYFEGIKAVGPRGTYLTGRTPKMYREEFVLCKLFNKDDPNNWQNAGAKTIEQAAHEQVEARLAAWQPPEITKEQRALIEPYIPEAFKSNF